MKQVQENLQVHLLEDVAVLLLVVGAQGQLEELLLLHCHALDLVLFLFYFFERFACETTWNALVHTLQNQLHILYRHVHSLALLVEEISSI
jgi:hypothetical protein